jgi:hypothetical protein
MKDSEFDTFCVTGQWLVEKATELIDKKNKAILEGIPINVHEYKEFAGRMTQWKSDYEKYLN